MSHYSLVGQTLRHHYKIIHQLGSGGFGDTYLAQDQDLPGQPQCVVKHLLPKDPNPAVLPIAISLFEREAQTLYQLGKDNNQIPSLLAHFEENREFYLVQEFVDGHDLSQEIIPGQPKGEKVVIKLLKDILEVLAVVHQQNVIHRDIKPENLMRRRKDGKIVLIDFGAVKEIGTLVVNAQGQTSFTVAVGSPGYMPSEQARGRPKLGSDVYAVGMMGIQALTGYLPLELKEDPNTGEVIWRNLAQVSNELAEVLDTMVRDHFSQRYQSAVTALQALIPIAEPPPPPPRILSQPTSPVTQQPVLSTFAFETATLLLRKVGLFGGASWEIQHSQRTAQYFTEALGNGITLEMISIAGGTFVMGSSETEQKRFNNEGPQHQVTIAPFYMGKFEVTPAQWQAVAALAKVKNDLKPNLSRFKGENQPVENVAWDDAVEFCERLSRKTGRTYRLPSEAEWEYACRAGTTTPFYFGETITPELANYDGNYTYGSGPKGKYRQQTTEVGRFPPNAFGLYDMHGNVWEWCADPYHDNYKGAPSDGRAWKTGINNSLQILRGGSWSSYPRFCRCAYRFGIQPDFRGDFIGFRVVCS